MSRDQKRAKTSLPPRRVNVALVGLGRAGNFHMNSLASLSDKARLAWAVDVKPELVEAACTRFPGCKGATDIDEALQDEQVDAVIVASLTYLHAGHIRKALEAGKAVLTEKPVSNDPEELKKVLDLVKEADRPFMVGFQRRFDRNFRALKAAIDSDQIGQPRVIRCTSRDNPFPPTEYMKISGGIFHDMLCHDFDMLYFLTKDLPKTVFSVGHNYTPFLDELNDIDTAMCTFKYESGLIASVDTSRQAAYGYDQRVEVFGEKGMAECRNEEMHRTLVSTISGSLSAPAQQTFGTRYPAAYADELEAFLIRCLKDEKPDAEELDWLIKLETITTAAELSHLLSRPVDIKDVDSLRHHLLSHTSQDA